MKKYPFEKQIHSFDCGACSLSMIVKYFGGNINLSKLRRLTKTYKEGTNAYNIIKAANKIGLSATGYHVDNIEKLTFPFIAHLKVDNLEHFVVVYKIDLRKNTVLVADPANKIIFLPLKDFINKWTKIAICFQKNKKLPIQKDISILKIFLNYAKDNKGLKLLILLFTLICIICSILINLLIKFIIDSPVIDYKYVIKFSLIFLIVIFIKNVSDYIRNKITIKYTFDVDKKITNDIYSRILKLPYDYYQMHPTGEIISKVEDIQSLKNLITEFFLTIILNIILIISFVITLLVINKMMVLIILTYLIFYVLISYLYFNKVKSNTYMVLESQGVVNSYLNESIKQYPSIKNFNLYNYVINKLKKKNSDSIEKQVKFNFLKLNEITLKSILNDGIILLIIVSGLMLMLNGRTSMGSVISFYTMTTYLISQIDSIFNYSYLINNSVVSYKRIKEIYEEKLEDANVSNLNICGDIEVKKLNFSYNTFNRILNNVSFCIKNGSKVLVNGKSGIGKSTIFKLLLKYYKVRRGKIFVGGVDVSSINISDLRKNILYVSQDDGLFNDSIKNNITFATEKDISEILEIVGLNKVFK